MQVLKCIVRYKAEAQYLVGKCRWIFTLVLLMEGKPDFAGLSMLRIGKDRMGILWGRVGWGGPVCDDLGSIEYHAVEV